MQMNASDMQWYKGSRYESYIDDTDDDTAK